MFILESPKICFYAHTWLYAHHIVPHNGKFKDVNIQLSGSNVHTKCREHYLMNDIQQREFYGPPNILCVTCKYTQSHTLCTIICLV